MINLPVGFGVLSAAVLPKVVDQIILTPLI